MRKPYDHPIPRTNYDAPLFIAWREIEKRHAQAKTDGIRKVKRNKNRYFKNYLIIPKRRMKMRFFEYDGQVVNLSHITNFSCHKKHIPHQGEDEDFTLIAELDYSNGFWEKEEVSMNPRIELGTFNTQSEGLQVARDIVAGKYDLPTVGAETPTLEAETAETPPVETTDAPPVETTTESAEEQSEEQTQEQPEDQELKEKTAQSARDLFKHQQTKTVAAELNVDIVKIHGEAQRLWGDSDDWNTEKWQNYITAIADFHQRKGVLYDKLKPRTGSETTQAA
ncbi:hypothetical protein F4Z99_04105 [Candidatus Poribacteria bacterium]|nr:hypothetical protein [Candidatus Poribacteria bacterium]